MITTATQKLEVQVDDQSTVVKVEFYASPGGRIAANGSAVAADATSITFRIQGYAGERIAVTFDTP